VVPEFRPIYDEHLRDQDGELLLHVLFADLAPFVVTAERAGDLVLLDRILTVAERLLVERDDKTEDTVAVSFVEHLGAETEPGEHEVVGRFPTALTAELERQRQWRPDS